MASASPLKDIDEQFLQCCICMEQLKEPKMLPCLHRYCCDCLKKVFKEKTEIECPTCREVHTPPEGGIDGLKTDFNTKNIIEVIQLQNSIEEDPQRTCIHCRKELKASAFCFKCNDFLCGSCHQFHASSPIVEDHRQHVFSLGDAAARNLTTQRLSSLRVAPRCRTHPAELSKLGCMTCGNLPICVLCSYGAHQGHNLKEVTSLAKIEREKLKGKIADLMQHKDEIYKMQEEIKKTRENLAKQTAEERVKLQDQLAAAEETLAEQIRHADNEVKEKQADLEENLKKKTSGRKQELKETIREATEEYERVCQQERQEADAELKKLHQENEREKKELQDGLDRINTHIQDLLASLRTQDEENTAKIRRLSDHFDRIVERFKTVTRAASSILAAGNDWADIQCIPDICMAVDALREEAEQEDHKETLSNITLGQKVDISKAEESVVDIKMDNKAQWQINGIASNAAGSVVISGRASTENESHITVIDMEGHQVKQQIFQAVSDPWRYCAFLSEFQIASVCLSGEISVHDIKDSTQRKINMKDAIGSELLIWSLTTDPANGNVIVGSYSRDVHVFNSQLEYKRKLSLPEGVFSARAMALHSGHLIVCDHRGGRAFAVTRDGPVSQIKYEFTKPDLDGSDWLPQSVCTDGDGHIYMLWLEGFELNRRVIIVQYLQDGGQIEAIKQVDREHYAWCMTTVKTQNGEKLLLPTLGTGLLITYNLK